MAGGKYYTVAESFQAARLADARSAGLILRVRQILIALRNYAVAVASATAALGAALFLRHHCLPHPFISFSFIAIAVTFWYAGTGPGLLALLLSYFEMSYFLVPLRIGALSSESSFIVYAVFGLSVGWFSRSRYRAYRLLSEARNHLEIRVEERTCDLVRSNKELQSARLELGTEKDRLGLLLDLTNNLVATPNIREALNTVIGTVRQITESDFVGVGLFDPDNPNYALDLVLDGDFDAGEFVPNEEALPIRVFHTDRALGGRTGDLNGNHVLENPRLDEQFKTVCVQPLQSRDRALGILVLARREDQPYARDDMNFLAQVSYQIGIALENALAYRKITELTEKLSQEKLYLQDEIRSESNFEEIIGTSSELRRVLKLVETVAPTDSTVLIYGETGTGKELIARAIHNLSPRREKTFVRLNCAAIPTGLLESELFGHERGAFTGAISQRIGRLELANHGTLFLDEIGEIPLELQPKLLRALQEREFERLGSTRTLRTDVRLIAATNRDLQVMVDLQQFRSDLFYRLNVFPVQIPPLRERAEDIPLLVRHFAQEFSRRLSRTIETIPSETLKALCQYRWPGNIRELQNVIERAVILSSGTSLNVPIAELQPQADIGVRDAGHSNGKPPRRRPVRSILAEVDRDEIIESLKASGGRIGGTAGAASRLGLKRTTFMTRMKKLGISVAELSEHDGAVTDTSDSSDTKVEGNSQLT